MTRAQRFAGPLITAGALVLVGLVGSASAADASTVGSCSAQGQFATCDASATVSEPSSISVTVTASPAQTVYVSWDDICSQGTGAGSESGSFTAVTPVTRTISHPYTHPDMCIVAAGAQLQNGGNSIHVVISSPAVTAPEIKGYAGKCVDDLGNSTANGTKIALWGCTGGGDQWWAFTNGKLVHNGRCLTDQGDGGNGGKTILDACSSAQDDLWVHKSNGEYVLVAHGGKLCLDDPMSATKNGTQLDVYTCKDAVNQRWTLP